MDILLYVAALLSPLIALALVVEAEAAHNREEAAAWDELNTQV